MPWETEFTTTSPKGQGVAYATFAQLGHSHAERRDRVRVSGKTVHEGWASDHKGFALYKLIQSQRWDSDTNGVHES